MNAPKGDMKENRRSWGLMLLLTIMLLLGLISGAAAESADPIRVSSQSEPQSVISERDVSITIKIYNNSQQSMEDAITLFDPDGVSVEKYNGLGAEQSVTYTGTWHVTSDQISKGKIVYYIRYSVDGKEITKTIPVTIQTEAAAPQMIASYSISPVSARQGQQMNIAYTLSNTGNIELRDITIKNPGISDKTLTASSLSVGERIVLEDVFQMGSSEMICEPQITYRSVDSGTVITVPDMTRRTLVPAEDGLEITLSAENTDNIYPGESIGLTAKLKNTGNSAYMGLAIRLNDGTEIASGISLAAGATYDATAQYVPTQSVELVATVAGMDAEGDTISIDSAPLSITTQDPSMALVLDVKAAAETTQITSEPAVVRFLIRVSNQGETDATTLTVSEAGTPVATIPSLPSGETRDVVVDIQTSIAGQIQFAVTGKDAAGNDKSYTSNIITLVYLEPTPVPTNTPAPTQVPPTPSPVPTATPVPTVLDQIAGMFSLQALQIAAGVLGGLIVLIIAVSAITVTQRNRRLNEAIDTIHLSPDVRDPTGRHKRKKPRKQAPKAEMANKGIVSATDLTEDDILPKSRPNEPNIKGNTNAQPKADAPAESGELESQRRRTARNPETTNDPTLRVEPMNKRPEYPQKHEADNSKTKVFNRKSEDDPAATKKVPVSKAPDLDIKPATTDETIRLSKESVEEARSQERSGKPEPAVKDKKMGLFGKRKKESEADNEEFFE
ncbi:MAG: hypothetical protein IJ242_11710 [Clostridia bacterium]|nr:hypothetical protein [Clostridia bacterium]